MIGAHQAQEAGRGPGETRPRFCVQLWAPCYREDIELLEEQGSCDRTGKAELQGVAEGPGVEIVLEDFEGLFQP